MEPVPIVAQVFFPLDEELALTAGQLTPKQQEHLAHLGSCMPFACAAQMLKEILGVHVSEPTVRRGTERAGAQYEAVQTALSREEETEVSEQSSQEKQVFSLDGAYVPLIGGVWAEVRTVAIGEVEQRSQPNAEEVQTHQLSYFSRMTDAQTFAELAEVEIRRRRVSQAKAVCAVTDGAPWIQDFIDLHRQDAVRILDFPHAAEHVGLLVEALSQAGVSLPHDCAQRCLHILKHRGPGLLLRWCERLPTTLVTQEAVQTQLDYFRKRLPLLDYPLFQQLGWPIGSGMVESANKLVVQARLKGAGMHWLPSHVNPMLALRGAICCTRWDEAWQQVAQQEQALRCTRRRERATHRSQVLVASLLLLLLRFRPPTLAQPAVTLPGSSRPSAHHPWKRGLFRRPPSVAKN